MYKIKSCRLYFKTILRSNFKSYLVQNLLLDKMYATSILGQKNKLHFDVAYKLRRKNIWLKINVWCRTDQVILLDQENFSSKKAFGWENKNLLIKQKHFCHYSTKQNVVLLRKFFISQMFFSNYFTVYSLEINRWHRESHLNQQLTIVQIKFYWPNYNFWIFFFSVNSCKITFGSKKIY